MTSDPCKKSDLRDATIREAERLLSDAIHIPHGARRNPHIVARAIMQADCDIASLIHD